MLLNLLWPKVVRQSPKFLMAHSNLDPDTAEYLCKLFPGTKIIYLVRNGIEVVSSRIVFNGFKDKSFESQCEVWAKSRVMANWGSKKDEFFLVRHEELLNANWVELVFQKIWEWLGLLPDDHCVKSFCESKYHSTRFPLEGEEAAHDLHKRKERWRLWTDLQREIFVKYCQSTMEYFQYEIPWLIK